MGLSLLPSHWEKWEERVQKGEKQKEIEIDKLIWQHKYRLNERAHQMKRKGKNTYFRAAWSLVHFPFTFRSIMD